MDANDLRILVGIAYGMELARKRMLLKMIWMMTVEPKFDSVAKVIAR